MFDAKNYRNWPISGLFFLKKKHGVVTSLV